jgi:hypothetical protein
MLANLLKIRLLQAQRELRSVGLLYAFFIAIVLFVVLYKIAFRGVAWMTDWQVAVLILALVASVHMARNDKRLLNAIFGTKVWQVYFLEYTLATLPFALDLALTGLFWTLPAIIGGCGVLAYVLNVVDFQRLISIKFSNTSSSIWLWWMIKPQNFEWRAGMRKTQAIIIPLYLGTLYMVTIDFAGFWLLGFMPLLFSGFYQEFESWQILLLQGTSAKEFINQKLKTHVGLFLVFVSPIVLLYLIVYPQRWYVFLALVSVYVLNFTVLILSKYKSYIPNGYNISNTTIMALIFMGVFLPYLFPISLVLVLVFYPKSIKNLKGYFGK